MERPLSGVKVLELSMFVAAPSCARLLADLGAEVIKIEKPEGDDWRNVGKSFHPDRYCDDFSPVFTIYNAGKRLISIDLKTEAGMAACHKILSQTDVFVTNLRPAALARLGLSYAALKEKYPSLIYAMLLGYGEEGPDAGKPAFDGTAFWAKSGFLRDMAPVTADYEPVICPSAVGDTVSGMFLMGEICAALYRRERTGMGDYVRSTLYHNGIFTMGTMGITNQDPAGKNLPKSRAEMGTDGYYRCRDDEWVFFSSSAMQKNIQGLYRILGISEIIPQMSSRQERYAVTKAAFLKKSCAEWVRLAAEADIPLVRMNHFGDPGQDEQAWANHFVEKVQFQNGETAIMPSSPIEMDSVGQLRTVPAPGVGHDTRAVLQELGYTDEELVVLEKESVVIL